MTRSTKLKPLSVTKQMQQGMRSLLADVERLEELALMHSTFSVELHEALIAVRWSVVVAQHRQEGGLCAP